MWITCPRCNGRGWVRMGSAYLLLCIPLFFDKLNTWTGTFDPEEEATRDYCPCCDGAQVIWVRSHRRRSW
jgi:hypothetical protein